MEDLRFTRTVSTIWPVKMYDHSFKLSPFGLKVAFSTWKAFYFH